MADQPAAPPDLGELRHLSELKDLREGPDPRELRDLDDADYQRLLLFRTGLRRFLHWSEQLAAEAGLTPAQHQLLLAIRGHADPRGPTVGDLAGYLLLRHHSAVGLVDRAAEAGLVLRRQDQADHRVVRLHLTGKSSQLLSQLTTLHLEELSRLGPQMRPIWEGLGD